MANRLEGTPTDEVMIGFEAGLNAIDLKERIAEGRPFGCYDRGFGMGDLVRIATYLDNVDRSEVAARMSGVLALWALEKEPEEEQDVSE